MVLLGQPYGAGPVTVSDIWRRGYRALPDSGEWEIVREKEFGTPSGVDT